MNKKLVEIDIEEVADAMGCDPAIQLHHYLDLETGEVLVIQDEFFYEEEGEEEELAGDSWQDDARRQSLEIEQNPKRYAEIPHRESWADYRRMVAFAEDVPQPDARELLAVALNGRGAFGRFRDVLSRFPALREQWGREQRLAHAGEIRQWLEGLGYEMRERTPIAAVEPPAAQDTRAATRILLHHVLLLGAPEGKTELLEGRVLRIVESTGTAKARRVFTSLTRQISELKGVRWSPQAVRKATSFDLDEFHLKLDEKLVELEVDVPPEIYRRFMG